MTQIKQARDTLDTDSGDDHTVVNYSGDVTQAKGYRLTSLKKHDIGITAELDLIGPPCNAFGVDVDKLVVDVEYHGDNQLRVHIFDKAQKHFQIPEHLLPISSGESPKNKELIWEYNPEPFEFWVSRPTGETLFDTRSKNIPVHPDPLLKDNIAVRDSTLPAYPLIFSDQYLQLASAVPDDTNIYGLGDVVSTAGFRRNNHGTVQAFWNSDPAGNPRDRNLYGTHAFYLESRWDKSTQKPASHGVFLRNSHGMDVILRTGVIEYRCLGGALDLTIVSGPSPVQVIEQYSNVVGRPAQMPFWSFGFHLCRIDYKSIEETQEAVDRMREAGIPLECMWNDFDYMDRKRNFTVSDRYPLEKYQKFIKFLHDNHQKYVPLLDAGMTKPTSPNDQYKPYEDGSKLDVFLKRDNHNEYEGQVWGGVTVWPDWSHKNTADWWHTCIADFKKLVDFDGLWLDMNEPANLPQATDKWLSTKAIIKMDGKTLVDMGQNKWDYPPYAIHNGWKALEDYTVAPSVLTADGQRHYHSHNLYPLQEVVLTRDSMEKLEPGIRPFMLSRGTFAGQGRLSAHWTGDNNSTWECLRESVAGVLQFQLFQMPMVGADVGGFGLPTTEELLNRWMQLGAFLPFYRNHNASTPQEPYLYPKVAKASREVLSLRYRLIPFWESIFAHAHLSGAPPVRPLFFEFDGQRLFDVDLQFMLGSSLLVTPCVHQGASTVTGHFPSDNGTFWRDWYTYELLSVAQGSTATVAAPLGHIPVHIRSGTAVLLHTEGRYTLTETKQCPLELLISLDKDNEASGEYYLDDGMSIQSNITKVSVSVSSSCLTLSVNGKYRIPQTLAQVTILGVETKPCKVVCGDKSLSFEFKSKTKSVLIQDIQHRMTERLELRWE